MLIYGIYIFYYAANDVKLLMDGRTIFCAIFFFVRPKKWCFNRKKTDGNSSSIVYKNDKFPNDTLK